MAYEHILVERDGPITVVTLNRPQVFNALHSPSNLELEAAFDAFASDPDQWLAIITGAGDRAFCAGNDLKYQASGGEIRRNKSGFGGLASRFDCDKPIIAAVNGYAFGGGFEVALACDLIIAAENAVFALPEPSVGLAALAGGLLRLPRVIGMKRAMGMILTGRRVRAPEGFELGFVNEVVPQGRSLAAAKELATKICELSPLSIRASKQAVLLGWDQPLQQAILDQFEFPAMETMLKSSDISEGPRAFAEKRKPKWSGR
jgi:crotonobetainyl-CoA hydratase